MLVRFFALFGLVWCSQKPYRDPVFVNDVNSLYKRLLDSTKNLTELSLLHFLTSPNTLSTHWTFLLACIASDNLGRTYLDYNHDNARVFDNGVEGTLVAVAKRYSDDVARQKLVLQRLALPEIFNESVNELVTSPPIEMVIRLIYKSLNKRADFLFMKSARNLSNNAANLIAQCNGYLPIQWIQGSGRSGKASIDRLMSIQGAISKVQFDERMDVNSAYVIDAESGKEVLLATFDKSMPIGILYYYHHDPEVGCLNVYIPSK